MGPMPNIALFDRAFSFVMGPMPNIALFDRAFSFVMGPMPNIALFDRAFPFVMGPMKSPNPGHAVNGFYKETYCYTPTDGKMPILYRQINN